YFLTWTSSGQTNRLGVEDDVDFTGYVPADYFLHESRKDYYSSYNQGGLESITPFTTGGYDSEFTEGEGWFRSAFTISTTLFTSTPGIYSLGPDAEAKYVLIGANEDVNNNNHDVDVTIGSGPANNHTYNSTKVNKLSYNIPLTYLGSVSTGFLFNPKAQNDRNTVGYISVKYAHSFDLGGASTYKMSVLDDQVSTKSFLSIDNFTTSSPCWLFDLTNHKRIKTIISNGIVQALVPNSNGEKECYLSSEASISTITDLKGVGSMGTAKFTDYTSIDPDSAYLIISNEKLYNDGSGYNYVNDYRNHRTSVDGGGYNVVLANIDELYDQFAYGIKKNPMAIRGFCNYALQNWSTPPQHLLLIGKSIQSVSCRNNVINYTNNLVPSYGYPPSDNLLTAGLAGTTWEPAIATGRIAASSWEEVKKYLDKIIEFDANQTTNLATQIKSDQEWKKQIIHLAGAEGLENVAIKGYLKEFEQIIEDTSYGGNVHTFSKNSSEPIQNSISDLITDLINNGVSLITFFGHASGSGFDQDIDDPGAYSNDDGKYPFLLANSCYVGDIHQPIDIFSNSIDWTLHERGVIGFLASILIGESYPLKVYTESFYRKLGQSMYGSSIGKCMISTISEVQQQTINKNVCLQMTLHGDPAVVLNTHKLPDYTITNPDVYTNPQDISADLDSFDLNMIVTNIGMAVNEELTLTVKRMFPPESNVSEDPIYYLYFSAPHYKDTLTLRLPVDIANGVGLNKFEIKIDADHYIDEISDFNNDIPAYSLWIITDDIRPIYPYEHAVIPEPLTSLKASTGDPFAPIETYVFEI
ncbi:MAG TPA: hypothetical protein EYN89_09875, partial [Flavobacteriales bacterium]|nr:hypothetical protein [Flavobacteriales bacterium]